MQCHENRKLFFYLTTTTKTKTSIIQTVYTLSEKLP